MKNTHGGVLLLVKFFTKSNTPPWVFFTFSKLYEWYQIAKSTIFRCYPGYHMNVWNTSNLDQIYNPFITPENVRNPLVFWRFQGVKKWNTGVAWVKVGRLNRYNLHAPPPHSPKQSNKEKNHNKKCNTKPQIFPFHFSVDQC